MCPCKRYTELIRQKRGERGTDREVHMKMGAKIGVMGPQAKESCQPLELRKGKEGFFSSSSKPPEGVGPCRHLDFSLLTSRIVKE